MMGLLPAVATRLLLLLPVRPALPDLIAARMAMPAARPAVIPPSGTSIANLSNVVWADPEWKSDGTGAMPIGNGDVTSSVWVDENTGDLRLLLSKSDVFDENSQPVKTGVLRLTFEPPLWQKKPRAALPPGPAHLQEGCTGGAATFCQSLDIATSTVTIRTPAVEVSVFVDLKQQDAEAASRHHDAGVVHVTAVATAAATAGFGLKVMLEPYRQEGKEILGRVTDNTTGYCYRRFEHADTVVSGAEDEIVWYHWNHINTSYQNDTMRNQGVAPELHPELRDIYTHRVWGGRVRADGLSGGGLTLTGQGLKKVDAQVTLLTLPNASPAMWIAELGKVGPTPPLSSAGCSASNKAAWVEIMDRSYIEVTAVDGSAAEMVKTARSITDHVNWDRYLSLIQGRVAFSPVKFNGQAFNCNNTGLGWDAREWGAAYWWQNTRQPYYNALAQGDFDTMRSFLDFYLRMLPYVRARTIAQFKGTDNPLTAGALYEETSTAFGMYQPKDWGCSTPTPAPDGASRNDFIRFHWTGGLELSLMVLDYYDATGNISDLRRYLPMAAEVVEAFRQRFPNTDSSGKTDMWPAQALETYQCLQPGSRFQCITNPSTDIAGLMSVLPKLIALPSSSGATVVQRERWQTQLDRLPPLPQGPTTNNASHRPPPVNAHKLYPVSEGWGFNQTQDQSSGWPGWGSRRNGENTDLYPVHPFRIFGMGKTTDISLAQQTYAERHDPCNTGWCQDIIQAAMLNMTTDATTQLVARATSSNHGGFRFEGFAGHYQDYEPSLDHYGFMRTGLDYMLLAPVDDTKRSVLLFPTFPSSQFNVRFKLHAPRNTTIEASCQAGQLEYLIVTPPERRTDVTVMNCGTSAPPPVPPPPPLPPPGPPGLSVWVDCERGKDSSNGSAVTPFATLRQARDSLRATRAHHGTDIKAQAVVNVVAGRVCRSYEQAEPGQPQNMSLVLDHRDSNTLWQAKTQTTEVGMTVLSGGIDATGLRPLSPAEKLWFKPSIADKIMAISLSGVMDDLGSIKGLSYSGGDACIRSDFFEAGGVELYQIVTCSNSNSNSSSSNSTCRATTTANAYSDAASKLPKMLMARYPDLREPPVPENWADYRDPNNTNLAITVNATAVQLKAWTDQVQHGGPEIWSHGLWKYNWADSHRQVLSVKNATTASGTAARLGLHHGDFPDRDCQLSAAKTGAQGGHVYVYNALWELDSMGEYVIDHHAKMIFLYPRNNPSTEHEASVATTLLTVNNATNISWVGLSFRGSRGAGIVLRNCTNVVVADGAVSDCGTNAFNVSGGARCGLVNMQVARAGTGGAVLEGGDRQTLTPGAHFVQGSHLRDSNRWLMNYAPLVLMAGVGQRVENSVLSEGPQMAVFVQGNNHQLRNSTIRDVMQQCNDCSAYYFGRDWTYRGMRISGCNFSLAGPMWESSNAMTNAIYADDYASSVSISRNTFYLGGNLQTVFLSNGGRDHVFTENVVKPLPPYSDGTGNSPRVDIENYGCGGSVGPYTCAACTTGGALLQAQFLNRVPFNSSDTWKTLFPDLYHFWETLPCEPGGVLVKDNVVCFKGQTIGQPIHATGSVVANNSWVPSVCGGPGPHPPPPSPPGPGPSPLPPTPLDVVEAHVGDCALMAAAQRFHHNDTNGAIYLTAGKNKGEVVAVSWATEGANGSPVNINPVDVPEFQKYKNVVFDIVPPQPWTTASVEIKLRVNGKCLTAPQKRPGQVTLEPCGLGAGSKWGIVTVGAEAKETFVLSSNAGGCVVNDHPEPSR